ncbi:hypothetical protein HDU83_009796, partial [Entophlyctis luteolus]
MDPLNWLLHKALPNVPKETRKTEINHNVTLNNVYYAPDLKANLLSTGILIQQGVKEVAEKGKTKFYLGKDEVMTATL